MTLTDALERDYIKVPLQARTKNAIIEELVEVLIKIAPPTTTKRSYRLYWLVKCWGVLVC